jgi:hypothetical protein
VESEDGNGRYYEAREFDLARNIETGHFMLFQAESIDDAAKACVYTLNLKRPEWRVAPSTLKAVRTVAKMTGDIAWSVRTERR